MAYINGNEIWCSIGFDLYAPAIIAGTVTSLPSAAFEGVTAIRDYAFYQMQTLKSVTIPDGVRHIGYSAFGSTALESIVMPNSIIDMDQQAFSSCKALKSVVLSQELTSIPVSAFLGCTALEGIDIPAKVDTIAGRAFQSCTALKTVTMRGATPPHLVAIAFNNVTLTSIVVPRGSADAYKAATNWSDYAEIITEAVE
jgi:hypothetical protein